MRKLDGTLPVPLVSATVDTATGAVTIDGSRGQRARNRRGRALNRCTTCGRPGHNSNNRKHHPEAGR